MKTFAGIAFTPGVRALQEADGSRASYARLPDERPAGEGLGPQETAFLQNADSFFMASVTETGWPYVQHRGGPRSFVKVLSPTHIAFADFRGNRQLVSAGNVAHDERVALIVMDYAHKRRLKLLGRLRFQNVNDAGPTLVAAIELPAYRARVERIAVIEIEAFDWNCPQHITPRYTLDEIAVASRPLHERIAQLEDELATLRGSAATPRDIHSRL
jgi:predicted pyridoxine 5'-phosphate oxidase superfamily flavin-nucleotide-binding protein